MLLCCTFQTINVHSQVQVHPEQDKNATFTWCSSTNNLPVDTDAELNNYEKVASVVVRNHVMNDEVVSVKEEEDVLHDVFLSYSNVVCHDVFRDTFEVTSDKLSGISHKCEQLQSDDISNVPNTSNVDEGNVDMLVNCNTDTDCDIFRRACVVERVQEVEVVECKYNIDTDDQTTTKSIHITANTTNKTNECVTCHKTFSCPGTLSRHKRIHSGIKPYNCQTCNKAFLDKRDLVRHTRIHTGEMPYVCGVCSKAFRYAVSLQIHNSFHTGVKPYTCHVCNKAFPYRYLLNQHDKRRHSTPNTNFAKTRYECSVCRKTCGCLFSLNRHKSVHSGIKPYTCHICRKAFRLKRFLDRHMVVHSDERPFVCGICSTAFKLKRLLDHHMVVHSDERPYVCGVYSKAFKTDTALRTHKVIHTNDRLFVCDVCSRAFNDASSLGRHKGIHTGLKPHVCNMCNKRFRLAFSLKMHKSIHTGDKPHKCHVCSKAFSDRYCASRHSRIHVTGAARETYKCGFCQRTFLCSMSRRRHERIHAGGDKLFKCNVCEKTFLWKAYLTQHAHIHTDEKTHACDVCDKKFSRASSLRAHKHTHTNDPYKCRFCRKSFAFSTKLYQHIRTIHFRTLQKTFQCDMCHRYFNRPCQTDEQESTEIVCIKRCWKCSSSFGSSSCLTATHTDTGLMVYDCDICNRRFDQEGKLTGPKPVNTVNRPSECGLCNGPYICACYLEIHKRTHIGDVSYECHVCNKVYASYKKFVVHKSQGSVCQILADKVQ